MNYPKTVCVITGTRAEYGLLKPLLSFLYADSDLEFHLTVTGAHLEVAFGETYREIEADGFPIHTKIKMALSSDSRSDIARATGEAIISFANYFESNRPHLVVILGDRYEMLAVAIAASMLCIPIAHIAGGDTSEGSMDEFIRHSITKMSYLHFPTNEQSRKRVVQLGENPERVFNVGSLGVDNIINLNLMSRKELTKKLGFDFKSEYALVTYHPVTMIGNDTNEIQQLLNAINGFPNLKFLFTKANADAGGRAINSLLDAFASSRTNCDVFASLGSIYYLSAMSNASMVIGNSSSGLHETPSFGIPCVNIGDRQRGRLRTENVIDCLPESEAIKSAINKARSKSFREISRSVKSPFGDGHAAERIHNVIKHHLFDVDIDLKKEFYQCIPLEKK